MIGVRLAVGGYATTMNVTPVRNTTYIVRCQVEYSAATQAVVLRCILENLTTARRCTFTDLEAVLVMLRAELTDLQAQMITLEQEYMNRLSSNG